MANPEKFDISPKKAAKINALIGRIDTIIEAAFEMERLYGKELKKVHPEYQESARNLIHYRALRSHDLNELQKGLRNMSMSRLARVQSHVLRSLYLNRAILKSFLGKEMKNSRKGVSYKKANRLLKTNAKTLLGYRSKGRRTRIMVTLPSEAANDYDLVKNMIAKGMNCARINCAHDDKQAWEKMIKHVRKASKQLKNKCKVAMDLAGPKIRTGPLVAGPRLRKLRLEKNDRGEIVQPLQILLSDQEVDTSGMPLLPLSGEDLQKLAIGDLLSFRDARNKKRKLKIIETHDNGLIAHCFKTTFLETGIELYTKKDKKEAIAKLGVIPTIEKPILLQKGDLLRLDREELAGESARHDAQGRLISVAHISSTEPEVFDDLKVGEPVLFDDGKMGGVIKSIQKEFAEIEIKHTAENGGKLRADKGMNFPLSKLSISGITQKDRLDLDFVVAHADVINLSFVNSPSDVRQLFNELKKRKAKSGLGVILKIETQRGFNKLTEILLAAMQLYPIGVMIARGDLAVECGWKNMGRVQMEILSFCQAAHVTDIWATQVLENLAKRGVPSRAEITDVVEAQQADCVMLNKGPFILDSIKLLDSILKS
ncbi:pyruvate kinase, partial [Ancylomarina sp.]|uniref:pyruvate kinase n=1 Tax=Ancylomarina sp. TaxID=1970196 RepID=UPI0035658D4C